MLADTIGKGLGIIALAILSMLALVASAALIARVGTDAAWRFLVLAGLGTCVIYLQKIWKVLK